MIEIPDTITRVTVVANRGVSCEVFADEWEVAIQDEGRTLKLFGKGSGQGPRGERDRALGSDLARSGRSLSTDPRDVPSDH